MSADVPGLADARRTARRLREPVEAARDLARRLGLEPYPVDYWIVDHDEMNTLIAYDGFPTRYPHWRWGMKYDRQRKQDRYGGGRVFEIVVNDDPAHAFLQASNAIADQKAVITHVEAHSDFFSNNGWYGMFVDDLDAAAMLERHARRIQGYMQDPEIGRESVERFIDTVLSLSDTIDQHRLFRSVTACRDDADGDAPDPSLDDLGIREEVRDAVFDEEWLERVLSPDDADAEEPEKDVLAFLRCHGKRYDDDTGRAVEMEPWQLDVLDMLRAEAYYFAAQRMTKVMNEGWAAYWESVMMGEEGFADVDEFVDYADHQSQVLNSPGLNPYKLGKELWEYVENRANRREVVERLLRVEGVTPSNFHERVDFDAVLGALEPPATLDGVATADMADVEALDDAYLDDDALERVREGTLDRERFPWRLLTYEGLARRHYSLVKPHNRGFLGRVRRAEIEEIDRYLFDDARYEDVEEALEDVEFTAGWDQMRAVRERHNDVTFLDAFLTREFVTRQGYFAYEHSHETGRHHVSSVDYRAVKNKLLFQFTNFGKPTVVVSDGNYDNRGELLLAHRYNGVMLDVPQAMRALERVFDLWGRPVNLVTVVKEYGNGPGTDARGEEVGRLIRYDGEEFETRDLPSEKLEDLVPSDVDYDTRPDEWPV